MESGAFIIHACMIDVSLSQKKLDKMLATECAQKIVNNSAEPGLDGVQEMQPRRREAKEGRSWVSLISTRERKSKIESDRETEREIERY